MTFKPMTYLVSFTLFVLTFMVLGGYVGYGKITDHFLVQGYLDALPVNVRVQADAQGNLLRWDDTVPLAGGLTVAITASSRALPIALRYSDQPAPGLTGIPLAANERTEDLRLDKTGRYLYARIFATSDIKEKEATWLCRYDLQSRRIARRTAVNPILLPAPFRP